jgi:outer membrane protein assembly factor BamB
MNLQTGQVMWTVPGSFNYGQIINWRSQQQRIDFGYLWNMQSGAYYMYDASTGALEAQWFNQPAGATVAIGKAPGFGGTTPLTTVLNSAVSVVSPAGGFSAPSIVQDPPSPTNIGEGIGGANGGGALLVYFTSHNAGQNNAYLCCWNSTLAINSYNNDPTVWNFESPGDFPSITQQLVTPLDWNNGIMWNITLPVRYTYAVSGAVTVTYPSVAGCDENYVIMSTGTTSPNATGTEYLQMFAYNIAQIPLGTFSTTPKTPLWDINVTLPAYDQTFPGGVHLASDGNIIITDTNLLTTWDFSETTGALMWTATPYQNDFSMQSTSVGTVAYGMLYQNGYDGYMHALNITTGIQQWVSITRPGALEMPEPGYPAAGAIVADNTVFCTTTKAYETQPAYRGHCLYAFDSTTGAQLWNISGEYTAAQMIVADGILTAFNMYDGEQFAFSRGPTATTVSAPQTTITAGQSVVLTGTVTDQTPGIAAGTPAISDAWMTPWMQYMYMDQPYPTNAVGVSVSIDAVDPNGNFVHIGNATSDISGTYIYQWTPPNIPGKYTIITSFASDNSYYGSCGETGAVVGSPLTTVAPTPTPTTVADMYFVPAIAGLFVLIVIVAIVLALLMLRKHP